jgi:hypothetical protein
VRTLKGSLRGVIVCTMDDGRVSVRIDGAADEMISLPENLLPNS